MRCTYALALLLAGSVAVARQEPDISVKKVNYGNTNVTNCSMPSEETLESMRYLSVSNPSYNDIDVALARLEGYGFDPEVAYQFVLWDIGMHYQQGDYSQEVVLDLVGYLKTKPGNKHTLITQLDEETIENAITYLREQKLPHFARLQKLYDDIRNLFMSGQYSHETALAWWQYAQERECIRDIEAFCSPEIEAALARLEAEQ